ncbi:efflux RND transporter permease subunit [Hirschia maritima]|uniref:efflux RND transporter permease subunit n=1 Tax=Hirschia maritima TaxID=1121961 RepID=UPI00036B2E69|nr:efflux RND transporter permease subunit [Hirschia maritima]
MGEIRNSADAFASQLAKFMLQWRWIVMIGALALTAAFASGASNLAFSTNYRVFFSDENPELNNFENFQATYTKNDNILIVVAPKNGDVFTNDTLRIVEELTEIGWQIPFASRVDSLTNFQHTYAEEDDLIVEDLASDAVNLSPEELQKIKDVSLSEPLLAKQLVTEKGDVTAVNVVLQYPEIDITEVPQAVGFIRTELERIRAENPDYTFALSGLSMLNNAFAEAGMIDMMTLFPMMFAVVLILMVLTIRSFTGSVVTMVIAIMSIMVGFGFGGLMGYALTPVSLSAMVIILTLAVADSIHIQMSARSAMAEGMNKKEAILDALRVNFSPVLITSVTTIIGFLALNFSDSPPYWHLGNMTAAGIAAAWLFSITILPALLSVLPMKVKVKEKGSEPVLMEKLANLVTTHWGKFIGASLAATIALTALVPTLEFNDQWVDYFDDTLEIRRDNDFALDHFGLYAIEYSIPAEAPGGVSEPEFLNYLEDFTEFLKTQDNVTHVYSISDIMKRLNKNLHADDPSYYKMPDDRDLSAQYLLLYELSLPYGLDLNDRINIDKSATRITATLGNVTSLETKTFLNAADAWLKENTPDYMQTQATGAQVMFTYVTDRNVQSMIKGNITAILAIAIVMIFALKSIRIGLLSMIPNTLPILATFGAWAVLVGTVGFSVASVAAVSLGIVVDDTVHFLSKYQRARTERNEAPTQAIAYAFKTVGAALIVNTVVLSIGFAVLAGSTFKLNADLGLMTALAIVFALILDFLFLPALLLLVDRKKTQDSNTQTPSLASNQGSI